MNKNCKYKCIEKLCPYILCLKQNYPVVCPKDEACKIYNSVEYNTDTSALPFSNKSEDIVRAACITKEDAESKDKEL